MSTRRLFALLLWPFLVNDLYVIGLHNRSLALLWSLDLVFYVVIPCATIWYLDRVGTLSVREILRRPAIPVSERGRLYRLGFINDILAASIFCIASLIVFQILINPILWSVLPATYIGYGFPESQPHRVIVVFYAAITTGVIEEVVFRGVILDRLASKWSGSRAIALASVLFGLIHWHGGPAHVAMATAWAIPVSVHYLIKRNLWVPILWHILYNLALWSPWQQTAA